MAKGHVSHYARTFFSIVSPVTRMHVAILEIDVNESLLALSLSLSLSLSFHSVPRAFSLRVEQFDNTLSE